MSDLSYINIPTEVLQSITVEQAWHYKVVPIRSDKNEIELYIDETKLNDDVLHELELFLGKKIILVKKPSELVSRTLLNYYRKNTRQSSPDRNLKIDYRSDDFLTELVVEARAMKSSDIHIECFEDRCRVRYRIDGKLIERYIINRDDYPALVNKIKIKANLDIAEKRLPQDGRIFFMDSAEKFDIRVSVLPTLHGEKIVLRLLSKENTKIDLDVLGFDDELLSIYLEAIRKPQGIILISGPTGSGKTTTLYATLKKLNNIYSNILTIEDPIEYTLEGVNQVQLKESIGLTFSSALRTFLRQDPDIIMVGEIRDAETAQMAIRAALTGHMVLSTVHTNSAWGTISRLIDMGIPPFLVANTLNISIAQRLVRILCPECKEKKNFSDELLPKMYKPKAIILEHFISVGCEHCFYTGYLGRKAVYEVIPVDADIAECIKGVKYDISEILQEKGISSLADNAFKLVADGKTSIDEIYPLLMSGQIN